MDKIYIIFEIIVKLFGSSLFFGGGLYILYMMYDEYKSRYCDLVCKIILLSTFGSIGVMLIASSFAIWFVKIKF